MMAVISVVLWGILVTLGAFFAFIIISTIVDMHTPTNRAKRRVDRLERRVARLGDKVRATEKRQTIARIKFEALRGMQERIEKLHAE